jgi:acetyl-CoA carboxylase biotin carboxyl carrier protein
MRDQATSTHDQADEAYAAILGLVCERTVQLLAAAEIPPRYMRVYAGDVGVELDWSRPAATVNSPVAVNPLAVADPPAFPAPDARPQAPAQAPADDQPDAESSFVTAPTVGVFYRCPEPGAKPFVEVDDAVEPGQQLGILEAMKLMNPILADESCRIVAILADDGSSVEYGQPLFAIEPR